jgi:glycine oxidase
MLDFLVVGFGLAGLSFTEQLKKHNKSFVVISEVHNSSSTVAGGMYNPVILKRFTSPWNALPQLAYCIPFYKEIEARLGTTVLFPLPVLRVFNSIEEQNNWMIASDKNSLSPFLSTSFKHNTNKFLNATNDFGVVENAGRLNVSKLLELYRNDLKEANNHLDISFNYSDLVFHDSHYIYNGIVVKNIVFCEGFGLKKNPFFNYLPLNGTKGEVLIISCKDLQLDAIIKSGIFIIPLEDKDTYLIGATYHWSDKTWLTTKEAREELIGKLSSVLLCDFEIVGQLAGIRPTVKDRRPLVGMHPKHNNMYVLNGLGTRGVMVAPMVSHQLINNIENNTPLDKEIDINRFAEFYIDSMSL